MQGQGLPRGNVLQSHQERPVGCPLAPAITRVLPAVVLRKRYPLIIRGVVDLRKAQGLGTGYVQDCTGRRGGSPTPTPLSGVKVSPAHRFCLPPLALQPRFTPARNCLPTTDMEKATRHCGGAHPAAPAVRILGDYHRTWEIVSCVNRPVEWAVVIATFLAGLSIVPRHCPRLTNFLHPKWRKITAVLSALALRRAVSAPR